MLKALRKKMKPILIATIIIIIPAFIGFYGLGRRGREGSPGVIAKVNGLKIYNDTYQRAKNSLRATYRGQWSEGMENQLGKEALEGLIREVLLRQETKRRRIKVSDEEVLEEIKSYPYFQREEKFDRDLYLRFLQVIRIDPHQFEEQVRNDLRTKKLLHQLVEGITISDEELREEYIKGNEQVRVKYLLFKGEDFKKGLTVEEKEVEDYFLAHREELKIPDKVNVEYVMISPNPEETKVGEEEIVNYYQEHPERYRKEGEKKTEDVSPAAAYLGEAPLIPLEEVRAEIRSVLANQKAEERAREEAENLAYKLFDRTTWKIGVKERNLEVKETGFFARGEAIKALGWTPDFVEEAFALEEDGVSEAIPTPKGYAIFVIKERRQAHLPELEEVKDKVEEQVSDKKARELARAKAEDCLRRLKEGSERQPSGLSPTWWEEMAKEFSLEVKDSELFTRQGYITGMGFSPPFAETAFSLEKGEVSPLVEVGPGFAILKGEEKKGIDEEKYMAEAETLRKNLLAQRQREAYQKWSRSLRERAKIWLHPKLREEWEEKSK